MSLLCKEDIVAKCEAVKIASSDSRHIRQNLLRTAMAKRKSCFADVDDDENHGLKTYAEVEV
jgi:hypothetical protein